jgi:hypothetical protein
MNDEFRMPGGAADEKLPANRVNAKWHLVERIFNLKSALIKILHAKNLEEAQEIAHAELHKQQQ